MLSRWRDINYDDYAMGHQSFKMHRIDISDPVNQQKFHHFRQKTASGASSDFMHFRQNNLVRIEILKPFQI